jgi:WD40 repeat protein
LAHKGAVFAVAFSTNGKLILTGSWDNSAQLWRTDTGERIGAPLSHKHAVTAVAFRPDGEVVATVSWNTVQLWSVSNQEPIGPPLKHKGLVWSAVFDESGNTLVTRSFETKGFVSEVVLTSWKLSGGDAEPLALGKLSHGGPAAVDLPSNTVAIGKQDGCARIWRIGVDELEALTPEHIGAVNGVAIRSGGDCLATAGDDGTALIWSGADRAPIQPTLHHDASVTAVAFGADDRIATQTADGAVRVWAIAPDVRGRKRSLLHDARVCSLYLSPNSDLLVTLCVDGRLSVWEVTSQSLNKHVQTVRQGELADVDSRGTAALIVDKERKLHMCRFDAGDLQPMGDDPVRIARFIPSTTTVLAGGEDGVLRVISESGQLLGRFDGHGAHIVSLACSVDGSRAITGGADKSAIVWSLPRCEKMGPALLHDGEVTAAALSDDGTAALTQSAKRLHLWNLQTVEPAARPIQPNDDSVMCCFNGAGTLLANAMRSRVLVFDTESSHRPLRAVHHVQGRLLGPMPIRFQSDGRGLIAASTEFGQVVLERFDAGSPAGAAIEGDPHELHERWQERLGLRFDSRKGNYVTRHP